MALAERSGLLPGRCFSPWNSLLAGYTLDEIHRHHALAPSPFLFCEPGFFLLLFWSQFARPDPAAGGAKRRTNRGRINRLGCLDFKGFWIRFSWHGVRCVLVSSRRCLRFVRYGDAGGAFCIFDSPQPDCGRFADVCPHRAMMRSACRSAIAHSLRARSRADIRPLRQSRACAPYPVQAAQRLEGYCSCFSWSSARRCCCPR